MVTVVPSNAVLFGVLETVLEKKEQHMLYFSTKDFAPDKALIRLLPLQHKIPNLAQVKDGAEFGKYNASEEDIIVFDKDGKEIARFKESDEDEVVSDYLAGKTQQPTLRKQIELSKDAKDILRDIDEILGKKQ